MTSFSYNMEQLPHSNYFPTPSLDSADDTSEHLFPILEAIDYLYHVSDPYYLNPEDALYDSVSSLYHLVSPYQNEQDQQLGYNSWRNWDGEYDSFTGYMDDTTFSYDCGDELQKAEDWFKRDGPVGQYDIAESQLSFDDCLWSGFKYETEDDSYYYARGEPADACSYNMDEIGFCEGILGYWPCLIQKLDELR